MEALKKSLKGGGGPSRDKADRFLEAHGRKAKPKAKAKTKTRRKIARPQARGLISCLAPTPPAAGLRRP